MNLQKIFHSVITKTLLAFILMVALTAGVAILTSGYLNQSLTQDLSQKQNSYIHTRIEKEREARIRQEERYIQLHARAIHNALAKALYTLDSETIRDILANLMKIEAVKELDLWDNLSKKRYVQVQKEGNTASYHYDEFPPPYTKGKSIALPLKIDRQEIGKLEIRYSMEHILKEASLKTRQEKEQFAALTRYLSQKLDEHFRLQMAGFLLFALLVVVVIAYLMNRYIKKPLNIVQHNLQNFFRFFRDSKGGIDLQNIDTDDEFGQISREINANIQTVLDLHREAEFTQKEILLTIGTIAEKHSRETSLHVKRVAHYSALLGEYWGLSPKEVELLKNASTLHDLGKIAIPDHILNKMGKLTPKEFEIVKKHTIHGYNMLRHSRRPLLQTAATIAYEHHERYDGQGYPRGLKGEEIHLYGRIVGLADVFDALSSNRVYKNPWKDEEIFAYLKEQRGKHFDPKLIDIFFEHLEEFLEIRRQFEDLKNAA